MLKLLEIIGFKSFADKTVLDFPAGITAIVGPNGAGKSNVVDAIRWVLGDQSVRNIRVSANADVIFSGTPHLPASSMAQVLLVFDNTNKVFATEYSEVVIARKIYLDGNSEFFLNKRQVRLKDITQLLATAKLGVKGMSIINQGDSDIFLRANTVERREIIEEMVGLKEFRLKKEEAERKIKETKDNLAQVQALFSEMEPNLNSLRRQVSRWQSRAEKEKELRELEKNYFAYKISEMLSIFSQANVSEKDIVDLSKEIQELRQEIERQRAEIEKRGVEDPAILRKKQELLVQRDDLNRKKAETLRLLGKIEGQLELMNTRQKSPILINAVSLKRGLARIREILEQVLEEQEVTRIKEKIQNALGILNEFFRDDFSQEENPEQQKLTAQQQELSQELNKILQQLDFFEKEIAKLNDSVGAKSLELKNLYQVLENQRSFLEQKEKRYEELRFLEEKKKLREEDLRVRLQEAGWDYEMFLKEYKGLIAQPPLTAEDFSQSEMRIIRLRRDLGAIGEVDEEIVKQYQELSERYQFLKQQKQDLEAALKDWESMNRSLEQKISSGFQQALKQINKEFNRYFGLIFNGGRASLRLEKIKRDSDEEDNILDQELQLGVDFSVQLPKKKVRSLDMLSGGEKTLTAIALLFAIISYARPLFLVFDEIDAALDEENSRKFARLLKELKTEVQFILITHNRAVMEAADLLYGITMSEGVSRVFSLRFSEAEKLAGQEIHSANINDA